MLDFQLRAGVLFIVPEMVLLFLRLANLLALIAQRLQIQSLARQLAATKSVNRELTLINANKNN
jgi:hypothetical protein